MDLRNLTKTFYMFVVAGLIATLALGLRPMRSAYAASFNVNSTLDGTDANLGDGVCRTILNRCTLRAAIQEANALPGTDTITLPAGTYTLIRAGIDDTALNGDLDINSTLILNGAGAGNTIIDANDLDRVFHITGAFKVSLSNLTVQDGSLPINGSGSAGGGIHNSGTLLLNNVVLTSNSSYESGGGLFNVGTAHLSFVTVSANDTNGGGGGILNTGTLTMTHSLVSGNSAVNAGGGGIGNAHGVITITFTTLSNNIATNSGGGGLSSVGGTVLISHSTVSINTANAGAGGVDARLNSQLAFVNSTVSGNSGGGIFVGSGATATLASVTVFGNASQGNGAGIFNGDGVVRFKNTIIGGNRGGTDCLGALESHAYNLIQNTDGCNITGDTTGNLLGVAPLLSPLQNNGGPTLTHFPGGSIIDAGNPSGCTDFNGVRLIWDQRGPGSFLFDRHTGWVDPDNERCDIGAVEYNVDI